MAFEASEDSDALMGEINMTPLVDVMLVLLIVFMLTVPAIEQAVTVRLPQAASAALDAPAPSLQLTVNAQGQFFLDRQAVGAHALAQRLREQVSHAPQTMLYIRGDGRAAYEHVAQALAAAQRAGLTRIGFVTEGVRP